MATKKKPAAPSIEAKRRAAYEREHAIVSTPAAKQANELAGLLRIAATQLASAELSAAQRSDLSERVQRAWTSWQTSNTNDAARIEALVEALDRVHGYPPTDLALARQTIVLSLARVDRAAAERIPAAKIDRALARWRTRGNPHDVGTQWETFGALAVAFGCSKVADFSKSARAVGYRSM